MTNLTALDGAPNFRDLGGLPLKDGGSTKQGVLYRSAALNALTDAGVEQLAASNIETIADLRTPEERQAQPDRLPTSRYIDDIDMPIAPGNMSPVALEKAVQSGADLSVVLAKQLPSLGGLYVEMLQQAPEVFANVARLTATAGTLVHCTAGKDRTGVACALILDAVGVQRAAVVADYAESQKNLAGPWAAAALAQAKSFGLPLIPQLVDIVTTTPPAAIEQAFQWVEDNFKSSADYLLHGGLSADDLAKLQARLVG